MSGTCNKNDIKDNILQIERTNERIMKMRLATNIHGKNNNPKYICPTHVLQRMGKRRILEKDRRDT